MAKRYFVTEKTAGWLREQMAARPGMATAGATRVDGRMGRDENGYPYPFEVCWSESESGGAWIVYLPSGSIVSAVGYEDILLEDLAPSANYAGWYVVEVSAGSSWTPLYLDCWATSEDDVVEYHAEITTSPSEHDGEVERHLVRIADIVTDQTSGAKKVRQIAVGALVLDGEGGYTGELTRLTRIAWEEYQIRAYGVVEHYLRGRLISVDDEDVISTIDSVPHSQLT